MESDILAKIIQAEREIHIEIEAARKTAEERVTTLKGKVEKKVLKEESLVREQCKKSLEEAVLQAQQKAAAIIQAATQKAERLKGLEDEALKRIVMKHIAGILPGERH